MKDQAPLVFAESSKCGRQISGERKSFAPSRKQDQLTSIFVGASDDNLNLSTPIFIHPCAKGVVRLKFVFPPESIASFVRCRHRPPSFRGSNSQGAEAS